MMNNLVCLDGNSHKGHHKLKNAHKMIKGVCHIFICMLFVSSCIPYKSLVNYNQSQLPTDPQVINNYTPIVLRPNDIIQIDVQSVESETTGMFANTNNEGYLIDNEGKIDFPFLGKVELEGKTISEAKKLILSRLETYFVKIPIVNIRLLNFRINVNGEVSGPGSFVIPNERVSLIDAITLAGDFTIYSRRDSILIIREENNMRSYGYVDFNNIDILDSPYFYLKQNDVVYVQPTKSKLGTVRGKEAQVLPWVSLGVSMVLLVTTILRVL